MSGDRKLTQVRKEKINGLFGLFNENSDLTKQRYFQNLPKFWGGAQQPWHVSHSMIRFSTSVSHPRSTS